MLNPWSGGRGAPLALSCLVAVFGFSWAAAAGSAAPLTFPSEACPIHGRIESSVSYDCAAEFTLRATNGYLITVSADLEGRSDEVELTVAGHGANAQYVVPGKVGADTIKARFGDLGDVSVRFHPSGRERDVRVPKKCMKERPRVVTSRLGRFVGTIKFRGERGYTQVSAHSAQGGTGDPLANTPKKLQCEFRESEAERRRELESVSLDASPPRAGIFFDAGRLFGDLPTGAGAGKALPPKGDRYLFFVLAGERVGQMSILHSAGAIGEARDFIFDDALTSATVSPPAPFTGSGSFLLNTDGSTSWTGDLSVAMPGLGAVGLTGGTADLATVGTRLERFEEEQKGVKRPASTRRARR